MIIKYLIFVKLKRQKFPPNLLNIRLPPQVPLAGDCPEAKEAVCSVLELMGYHSTDLGPLRRARDIENIPLYLFINWRRPLAVSTRNLSLSAQPTNVKL